MKKKYDTLVYIGRFQPFHNGHLHVINEAKKRARKVIVLAGSASGPLTGRNPFASNLVMNMIVTSTGRHRDPTPIAIEPLFDYTYENPLWIEQVRRIVARHQTQDAWQVGIIGHRRDDSSFYLDCFPEWPVEIIEEHQCESGVPVSATRIRELMFGGETLEVPEEIGTLMPAPAFRMLQNIIAGDGRYGFNYFHLSQVHKDVQAIKAYREKYGNGPFNAVDALVICGDKILLVERGKMPQRFSFAMPGGFIEPGEATETAVSRELFEETGLNLELLPQQFSFNKFVVKRIGSEVFNHPRRSSRAQIATTVHLIELKPLQGNDPPPVKGADDAYSAKWYSLDFMMQPHQQRLFFDDHWHIIHKLLVDHGYLNNSLSDDDTIAA